ncbi:MAG TPA: hypothetical protein VEA19_04520, partial [Actinomycetota bacterium]|nr:hypothetical protein [Actinomycetota bacterium]
VATAVPTQDAVPAGPLLAITDEAGARTSPSTCEKFDRRKGGRVVEVGLSFEGGTVSFTVSRFKGPGAYPAHQGVKVGGSFLSGGGTVSGAVVFSQGREGSVNLVRGARAVTGSWSCA